MASAPEASNAMPARTEAPTGTPVTASGVSGELTSTVSAGCPGGVTASTTGATSVNVPGLTAGTAYTVEV